MKPKVISERTWQGQQSWNREVIEQVGERRVRYRVKVDSYDFQSSATAELWVGTEWKNIHRIPGQELRLPISYVDRGIKAAHFGPVMVELRRVAEAVLG
jgi:hypothetical protein